MAADSKWKAMESEMDKFEAEISSMTRQPSFVPSQIRRPAPPTLGMPRMLAPPITTPAVVSAPPQIRKPAPVVLSGAPQRYASSSTTISAAPSLRPMIPSSMHPASIRAPSATSMASVAGPSTTLVPVILPGTSASIPLATPGPAEAIKPGSSTEAQKKKKKKKKDDGKPKKAIRCAGGTVWEDQTMADWDPSDFRIFCGDLGNDVTDEVLVRVFGRYPSFQKAKVVRDRRTNKTKGYGFVSFKDPNDFVRAIRELDGRYVGSRPIKLRKSNWKNRNIDVARKRDKERNQLIGITKPIGKP